MQALKEIALAVGLSAIVVAFSYVVIWLAQLACYWYESRRPHG